MVKDANRRRYPLCDRYIEVVNQALTGEVLLDEALKMMKVSEKMSVSSWIDLMSGKIQLQKKKKVSIFYLYYCVRRDMECYENWIPVKTST